jgi:hypothetical protein
MSEYSRITEMRGDEFEIESVKLKDLYSFASGIYNEKEKHFTLPITLHRARVQQSNPHADPDDIVLIAAFKDGQCVGYHGLLPGLLRVEDKTYPVFWGSTFFVAEEFRRCRIAYHILQVVKRLNIDFITTQLTPVVQKAYIKAGVKELGYVSYYQLRMDRTRPSALLEPQAGDSYPDLKKHAYQHLNHMFYDDPEKITWRIIDQVTAPEDSNVFKDRAPFFQRDLSVVLWMLQDKWIHSKKDGMKKEQNYYFSSVKDVFEYIALGFYSNDTYLGYLVFSLAHFRGRTTLKTLDYDLLPQCYPESACRAALSLGSRYMADRVEMHMPMGAFLSKFDGCRKYLKLQHRRYLCYQGAKESPLKKSTLSVKLSYFDGDTPFA